ALMVETLDLIEMKGLAVPDLSRIDFADKATAQLLATGDSAGVYCLESADMQKLLPQVPPQSLTDVAILQALAFIMPDPSENSRLRDYIERKQGRRETSAAFAELDPFLEDTRGLIIYQEQIMRIAQIMAGYTPAESDRFWIAMGRKVAADIEHHRQQFLQGAVSNGVDTATARQIYEHLVDFGGYAHNKAHGIACALSTWQSAYLKAHFPVEFAAALTKSTSMSME
ncbi:MAG: DNA polymerase III subunit alpha, partial [Desulfosudaceae bacterium]